MATQKFNGGSYRNIDEVGISGINSRLIDVFVDNVDNIVGKPGYGLLKELGITGKCRGMFYWSDQNVLIICIGTQVYKYNLTTLVLLNITADPLVNNGLPVIFASDGDTVKLAFGGPLISITPTGTTTYVVHENLPTNVTHVVFYGGYFIVNEVGTGRFHHTTPGDVNNWPVDGFFTAESCSDNVVALHVFNGELYVFGSLSVEVWVTDGVNPFSPVTSASINVGVSAIYSILNTAESLVWLDHERRFICVTGRDLSNIGTPYQRIIDMMEQVSDCISFAVTIQGQMFYIFTFFNSNITLVYNPINKTWTEWGTWNGSSYDKYTLLCSSNTSVNVNLPQTSIEKNAGTGSNDNSIGTLSWSNPTNAQGAQDSLYAQVIFTSNNAISNYIKLSNFNLSLPSYATILGIKVIIYLANPYAGLYGIYGDSIYGDTGDMLIKGTMKDYVVKLVKNGTVVGDNKASGTTLSFDQALTYGDNSDLWGSSWTASDVNNSNFGVALSFQCNSYTATPGDIEPFTAVNSMQLIITYTLSEITTNNFNYICGHISDGNLYVLNNNLHKDRTVIARPYIKTGVFEYGTLKDKIANAIKIALKQSTGDIYIRWIDEHGVSNIEQVSMANVPILLSGLGRYQRRIYEMWYNTDDDFMFINFEEDTELTR